MTKFKVFETTNFLSDVEASAVWILESNLDFSEEFAIQKVEEFQAEIEALKKRLQNYPESGEEDEIKGIRKFPVLSKFMCKFGFWPRQSTLPSNWVTSPV